MTSLLAENALLVILNVHSWTAEVTDLSATRELAYNAEANQDYTRVTKKLLDKASMDAVRTTSKVVRAEHNRLTLPYDDSNYRILPVKAYDLYRDTINAKIEDLITARNTLLDNYQRYIDQHRPELGKLFNIADYPTTDVLAEKISASYRFMQIADTSHFVADLADSERQTIIEKIEQNHQAQLRIAVASLYDQIQDVTARVSSRLVDDEEGNALPFRKQRLLDLQNLVETLPLLNITEDPFLTETHRKLQRAIRDVHVDELRPKNKSFDPAKRQTLKQTVDDLAERFAGYAPVAVELAA